MNMCLAIARKVLEISADAQGVRMARANFGGVVTPPREYPPKSNYAAMCWRMSVSPWAR